MKKNTNVKKTYSKDEVAVILEDLRSQFMVFGEGQDVLSRKADNLEAKVDVIDKKLENVEIKVDVMDERLKNVEIKVDVMDERLVRVEDNVVEIKDNLSKKVDLEDFKELEAGHIKLEKIVFQKVLIK